MGAIIPYRKRKPGGGRKKSPTCTGCGAVRGKVKWGRGALCTACTCNRQREYRRLNKLKVNRYEAKRRAKPENQEYQRQYQKDYVALYGRNEGNVGTQEEARSQRVEG